jgi:S1-C subfamily serine protease
MKPAGLQVSVSEHVARAVVRLPRLIGQGVLVPGGFIVTAARCVGWTPECSMTLGGCLPEPIITADGRKILAAPLAVEPVADLAVLGAMDDQAFAKEAAAFAAFCDATPPVRVAIDTLKAFVALPAYVFTHDRGVIPATVRLIGPGSASLWLHSDHRISRGTSGGPVVTEDGRLWGIISTIGTGPEEEPCQGFIPRVHLAAPVWLVRQMVTADAWGRLGAALPPCRRRPLQRRSRKRQDRGAHGATGLV